MDSKYNVNIITKKQALKTLCELAYQDIRIKHPNFPEYAIPQPKYRDNTANGLTRCIIDFINFKGGQAERINNTGRYLNGGKAKNLLSGIDVQLPGKFIPGTGTKGTADISATINGRSVKIEVKIGKDKQSQHQLQYQRKIEEAGGIYIIAKDFEGFYSWYLMTFENGR